MKFESFRELLAKKTEDQTLQTLVKFMREDILAELLFESLEKMARNSGKGKKANYAVRDFGVEMDPELEPEMMREAMGHHASHYKAALKSGRKDLADKHAHQLFRLVDLAERAQPHSRGKLDVSSIHPAPWERHSKPDQYGEDHALVQSGHRKSSDYKTDTKGWGYRGKDFDFLRREPHPWKTDEVKKHGHNQAFPMEQIRVNGQYIPIEDVKDLRGYEEHPFDQHPIMTHFEEPAKHRTPDRDKQYISERDAYLDSPHIDTHHDRMDTLEQADPKGFASRGSSAGDPVHDSVPGLNLESGSSPAAQPAAQPTKTETSQIDPSHIPAHLRHLIKG